MTERPELVWPLAETERAVQERAKDISLEMAASGRLGLRAPRGDLLVRRVLPGGKRRDVPPAHPATSPPAHHPRTRPLNASRSAEYADSWSSWGGYQIETEKQMFAATKDRCARFDDLCTQFGRDPKTVWHSLVCFPPLTPWDSVGYFGEMIEHYNEIGIDEFVLYWPQTWREQAREDSVFEEVTQELMPALRQ